MLKNPYILKQSTGFSYKQGVLHCENVTVPYIVRRYGTPVYIYSRSAIKSNYQKYERAFSAIPHIICYAVKANSNTHILKDLARGNAGADIVSGGELYKTIKAGIKPSRIVFAGVGKTEEDIRYALRSRILMFNVESLDELKLINQTAHIMHLKAPISFRINPDIDAQTHHHITTGKKENKFGIHFPHVIEHFMAAKQMKAVEVVGIHAHIGSQLLVLQPFISSVKKLLEIVRMLDILNIQLRYFDIGGGLGICYHREQPPTPHDLAGAVIPLVKKTGLTLIVEPGRSIAGNTGILVTKVLYNKYTGHKHFMIVDAAMNDLMRPAMYDAFHEILPVVYNRKMAVISADVVGPVCETGDYLARSRKIHMHQPGETIAIMCAGAYGFSMSSQYNCRLRPAEVMVSGTSVRGIRSRETFQDLIEKEM